MAVMNSATVSKALWPGVRKFYGLAYKELTPEYTKFFEINKSTKAWEEEVGLTGFGLAPLKAQGGSITYDQQYQGYISRYTHAVYGLGFIITREAYEDNQYAEMGRRRSRALAFSIRRTKEHVHANIFNRAFNSNYTGGDGKEMCADDHPNVTGGTWSNELSVAADLSETALEQACIDIGNFTDDRGGKMAAMAKILAIPPALEFEAGRILQSILQNDTANNAVNVIRANGKIPGGAQLCHYFTDTDAWFIITDVPDGLKSFNRRPDDFAQDNDFDTENAKFKATSRYSAGCTDNHGIFGSPGG